MVPTLSSYKLKLGEFFNFFNICPVDHHTSGFNIVAFQILNFSVNLIKKTDFNAKKLQSAMSISP